MANPDVPVALAPSRRRSSFRWPMIIIALLAVHVVGMTVAVMVAVRDPGFAVVPNYYQRAVHWDEEQAMIKASRELGWSARIDPSSQVSAGGNRVLTFKLTDAQGRGIAQAAVELIYFHHAHGDQPRTLKFTTGVDGSYDCATPMRYPGLWEFHVNVSALGKTFVQTTSVDLASASALSAK